MTLEVRRSVGGASKRLLAAAFMLAGSIAVIVADFADPAHQDSVSRYRIFFNPAGDFIMMLLGLIMSFMSLREFARLGFDLVTRMPVVVVGGDGLTYRNFWSRTESYLYSDILYFQKRDRVFKAGFGRQKEQYIDLFLRSDNNRKYGKQAKKSLYIRALDARRHDIMIELSKHVEMREA